MRWHENFCRRFYVSGTQGEGVGYGDNGKTISFSPKLTLFEKKKYKKEIIKANQNSETRLMLAANRDRWLAIEPRRFFMFTKNKNVYCHFVHFQASEVDLS